MSEMLAASLFQSRTRTAVLDLLFLRGLSLSVSDLARRSRLTARSVAREVRNLEQIGLVRVEAVGRADIVHPVRGHPAAKHLRALLRLAAAPEKAQGAERLRQSLAAFGAPLAGTRGKAHLSLEEALLAALEAARSDATLLRVLPVVLAKNRRRVDWPALMRSARARKLKAELGWLADLTSELTRDPALLRHAEELRDRRRRSNCFYPRPHSEFERRLAIQNSPAAARRWGFFMNMTTESFRSSLEKHGAT